MDDTGLENVEEMTLDLEEFVVDFDIEVADYDED